MGNEEYTWIWFLNRGQRFLNLKIYAKTRIINLEFEELGSNLHTNNLLKELVSKLGLKILFKRKN